LASATALWYKGLTMSDDHTVRIALLQHACSPQRDPAGNITRTIAMIRDAAGEGAQLVATQELFEHRYFPQTQDEANFALAESIPGPTSTRLCALARELGIELIASLFEKRAAGLFHNTALLINAHGEIAGLYRKMHIPDDPRFYEKYYFTPGDADDPGWTVWRTAHTTAGVLICWDQWFPEAARLSALRGAQILFFPSAIGWYHGETEADRIQQQTAWRIVQRSHAITNGVFVAAINRVGVEDDLEFWGSSFIADPGGSIIAEASPTDEAILIADCDLRLIDTYRQGWPFLRDRRIDAYGQITQRMIDAAPTPDPES
jgi:N-carbamoylputrescine amidase